MIEAKILKGFRDYLPGVMIQKERLIYNFKQIFQLYGFSPIETPSLEYSEILLGKGSDETDKQLFRFLDNGKRDVSLRFDLTVPLARFVSMHKNELSFPFKRYHVGNVWRAEKPQRGRFREFIQCDFDTLGSHSKNQDAEILEITHSCISSLNLKHKLKINNIKLLSAIISNTFNISSTETNKFNEILRAIDKLDKLKKDVVSSELKEQRYKSEDIERLFQILEIGNTKTNFSEVLNSLERELRAIFNSKFENLELGLNELRLIDRYLNSSGLDLSCFTVDLSIARGLNYYTSTVYETTLLDAKEFGSVSSGGRYDNLVELFQKEEIPGVGGSIGLDRLVSAIESLSPALNFGPKVFIINLSDEYLKNAQKLRRELVKAKIPAEIGFDQGKLSNQLKLADKKKIPFVVIIGEDEFKNNFYTLKNLKTGEQKNRLTLTDVVSELKS